MHPLLKPKTISPSTVVLIALLSLIVAAYLGALSRVVWP